MEINQNVRNLVFFCEGGIGKNIMATAVIRAIKKVHPKLNIIVMAGTPEVFMNNPNVKRTFHFQNALHFYDDWVNDETCFVKAEPYLHYDYIQKSRHLVECWCDMIGVPCDGIQPDIYLTPNEIEAGKIFTDEKDLVLVQWIGGPIPDKKDQRSIKDKLASMYRRSMPQAQAQEIVNYFHDKKYTVLDVGHNNFPDLLNTKRPQLPIRAVLSLLAYAKTFVGIDSFIQHAAAAHQINKQGVVVWGGTSKTCLGYDTHINLEVNACTTPACHRPNSYLMDIQPNGQMWDCPWGEPCMKRTIGEITTAVEKVIGV